MPRLSCSARSSGQSSGTKHARRDDGGGQCLSVAGCAFGTAVPLLTFTPAFASNTVAAFALGDYEWLLALEADELTDLVDLMRHLRASGARRHVRLEVPFFTGHRITAADLPRVLR